MTRMLLVTMLLAGCKNHARDAEERRELASDILDNARAFGKAMCACPDEACAQKTSERWERWTEQAKAELASLEQKHGETVRASQQAIDEAFAAFEQCAIRFSIGRAFKGSAGN